MSSRVNQDRPQPYLKDPIELLTTTETATPDEFIIQNFDGEFKVVVAVHVQNVILQIRVRAHSSSRDGSAVDATDWVTSDTYNATGEHTALMSRNCEYRCTTSAAGSRLFIADAQWQGVI